MQHPSSSGNGRRIGAFERLLAAGALLACGGIVLFKFFVAWRININWDEFWFLSFVHSLLRNELTMVMQGAYTHLFTWLPAVGPNEADQVVAARMVMLALWALTAWLIWLLARRLFDGLAATAPPFVYLTLAPVMAHGGSFRADSMLAPLLMITVLLLFSSRRTARDELLAGIALGCAAAITIKVLLFVPMLVVLFFAAKRDPMAHWREQSSRMFMDAARVGVVFAATAIAAIGLHAWIIAGAETTIPAAVAAESIGSFATRTTSAALLEAGPLPRGDILLLYADWQPLPWLLLGLGAVASLCRRRFDVFALALALSPILFYRNAYPYFYVVMFAPASLLVGYSVTIIGDYVAEKSPRLGLPAFHVLVWLGLAYQGLNTAGRFLTDNQSIQREVIAGVHQIFPLQTNYIDRCGMISSYRKVSFFMSTWGMAAYRAAGVPVMNDIATNARPAFLIMNVPALMTSRPHSRGLLEPDRDFLQRAYSRYWGPVKVAGGTGVLSATEAGRLHVPFPARYRIESPVPVIVEGVVRQPDETFEVADSVEIRTVTGFEPPEPLPIKLVLAAADPPPASEPPPRELFTGL